MAMSVALRVRMMQRGVSQRTIAQALGVTKEAVYQEFSGRRVSQKIRDEIMKQVGWPAKKIWPNGHRPYRQPAETPVPEKVA